MNASNKGQKAKAAGKPSKATNSIVLQFDNNALAAQLFGEYDQHLAIVEQELNIEAVSRGNQVTLRGEPSQIQSARVVLEHLYHSLESGSEITAGDVKGAIRMSSAASKKDKSSKEKRSGLSMAKIATRKKVIQARSPRQDAYIRAMDDNELIFGVGPAGTGKTYLAVAYAASLLERGVIDRIILSRPAVEAGERLGFLPGDMKEKVDPYLRPLYDALYDMMPGDQIEKALDTEVIEIAPLAFMRGRTLANAVVILDEAQNTTSMQMKMFLTRLGENSRMIVTGDPSQVDLPKGVTSGLKEAQAILGNVKGVSKNIFTSKDVVRHPLVAKIINAYEKAERSKFDSSHNNPKDEVAEGSDEPQN